MTKTQLVALGIRIFGIVIILYVIQSAGAYIPIVIKQSQEMTELITFSLMLVCIFLVVGFTFIKYPLCIAGKLLPKDGDDKLDWQLNIQDVYTISFFLLGLFVLVNAIPNLFFWVMYGFTYKYTEASVYKEFSPSDIGAMTSTTIKILIGMWLLFLFQTNVEA